MKIALYARVSTKDKGQDTENQLTQMREFAAAQKWTVAHAYIDRTSGKHSDRDQFQKLFADASRRFDLMLFWSLDRFSREGVLETLNHLRRLEAAGVGFRSLTEQYLDSCGIFKDAVLSILATIAKQERFGEASGRQPRSRGYGAMANRIGSDGSAMCLIATVRAAFARTGGALGRSLRSWARVR